MSYSSLHSTAWLVCPVLLLTIVVQNLNPSFVLYWTGPTKSFSSYKCYTRRNKLWKNLLNILVTKLCPLLFSNASYLSCNSSSWPDVHAIVQVTSIFFSFIYSLLHHPLHIPQLISFSLTSIEKEYVKALLHRCLNAANKSNVVKFFFFEDCFRLSIKSTKDIQYVWNPL